MCDESPHPVVEILVSGVVVGLFGTNCYIVGSRQRGEAVVLDPGDEPEKILELARDMGVRITRIVSTHAHLDHVIAAQAMKEATGAPFLLHTADADILAGVPDSALRLLGREIQSIPEPDFWLNGSEDIEVDGLSLSTIHTPGHTPGSVSLFCDEGKLLFSGDTLFRGTIGRTDLQGGDFDTLIHSLHSSLASLPDETRVLPGHMQETTIGVEKATNPFFRAA